MFLLWCLVWRWSTTRQFLHMFTKQQKKTESWFAVWFDLIWFDWSIWSYRIYSIWITFLGSFFQDDNINGPGSRPDPALLINTGSGTMTFRFTPLTGAPSGWSPTIRSLDGDGWLGWRWFLVMVFGDVQKLELGEFPNFEWFQLRFKVWPWNIPMRVCHAGLAPEATPCTATMVWAVSCASAMKATWMAPPRWNWSLEDWWKDDSTSVGELGGLVTW